MRVLIAEDEAFIRLDLRWQLEQHGLDVIGEARNGQEAVDLARELEPDLAVLDVRMPRLDGIEVARQITASRPIPIVLATAHTDEALVARAIEAGVSAYLVKPFREDELLPAIRMAAARHADLLDARGTRRPRRRSKPDGERRRVLLEAAARIFHERGYAAASIEEISTAAGILKGSLYYHFASKEALFSEVLRTANEEAWRNVELTRASQGDASTRLRGFAERQHDFAAQRPQLAALLFRPSTDVTAQLREQIDTARGAYVDFLYEVIRRGQQDAELREDVDARVAAAALLEIVSWGGGTPTDGDRTAARAVSELIISGLGR